MRLVFFLMACSAAEAPAAPDLAPDACQQLQAGLQAAADEKRTSPNAVIAMKNAACGTLVVVSGDPATAGADSLYRIGSITKTFVSATILSLVKEGKLTLDDPLSQWVVNVADGVSVRMLLNHTSGIFNYTEDPSFGRDLTRAWTPRELVDLALTHAAYFAPGTDFHYSNTNYILLGMIAELAGGAKVSALMRARAIGPAGLAHTFFDGEEPLEGDLARGYSGSRRDVTTAINPSGPWAAGAMVSSPADLVQWVGALYGSSRVLDDAQRQLLVDGATNDYGLGVVIVPASATRGAGIGVGHDGAITGFQSSAFYFADPDLSLAALVNQDTADPNPLMAAALGVLFP